MSRFGKPAQTGIEMRCLACGATFRDCDADLKHAGRSVDGDFWNTICPECGTADAMHARYTNMTDRQFREVQHEMARQERRATVIPQ